MKSSKWKSRSLPASLEIQWYTGIVPKIIIGDPRPLRKSILLVRRQFLDAKSRIYYEFEARASGKISEVEKILQKRWFV